MFVDECKLVLESGKGGNGVVAFLREKHRPWGGPAGGDGGDGGDVILEASRNEDTLYYLSRQRKIVADSGTDGRNNKQFGRKGADKTVRVPVGTVVKDAKSGTLIVDMSTDGQRFVICKGGKGGRGNQHFATPERRTPRHAEPGGEPEIRSLQLELKLIADVGLAGLPNAGKSSLLSRLSAARPKVADYPFTTLVPSVGVVPFSDTRSFVMADIPGLIEGAHTGQGLGHQFLRHIERTSVILHVVDLHPLDASDPVENFQKIQSELASYSDVLAKRPFCIAANKLDLSENQEALTQFRTSIHKSLPDCKVFGISCVSGEGLDVLVRALYEWVRTLRTSEGAWSPSGSPVATPSASNPESTGKVNS